jgi:hypothetical protein
MYIDQKILLRKNLLLGQIVKFLPNDKILVSYYEKNIFKYDIIDESEIIDEKEYDVIKNRVNSINKLLDS